MSKEKYGEMAVRIVTQQRHSLQRTVYVRCEHGA